MAPGVWGNTVLAGSGSSLKAKISALLNLTLSRIPPSASGSGAAAPSAETGLEAPAPEFE
jgi:hypothetical protein